MSRQCDRRRFLKTTTLAASGLVTMGAKAAAADGSPSGGGKPFRAGAQTIDTTPPKLPVIVNGYTFERIVDAVHDPLHARCLVLDDGATRIAIAVVDICVMPRHLIDQAKRLAREATGIPTDRMLIAATHTHSAPSGYYGRFVRAITKRIGADELEPPFVAAMSQGTSGDQMYMDYSKPNPELDIDSYADAVAEVAFRAYGKIEYHDWVPLAMAERKLMLRRRVPDEKRLAWANGVVQQMGDRPPRDREEIFAREQIYLHQDPTAALKLQALRIGDLGITAIPCEVYGITGLKIKAQSPLVPTVNFSLANGEEGYIPPPEQHKLGGYSTWEARTAGLEEEAEPKIVDAVLGLLEQVSQEPRRKVVETHGEYARAVLASTPFACWRMSELAGPTAADSSGSGRHGRYEDGVAFYLEGPPSATFSRQQTINRAAHFAGYFLLSRRRRRARCRRRPPGHRRHRGSTRPADLLQRQPFETAPRRDDRVGPQDLVLRRIGPRRSQGHRLPQRQPPAGDRRGGRRCPARRHRAALPRRRLRRVIAITRFVRFACKIRTPTGSASGSNPSPRTLEARRLYV